MKLENVMLFSKYNIELKEKMKKEEEGKLK